MSNENNYPIKANAIIYQGELDYISQCVLDYPNIETGGDLFGFWTYSGFPVIQYVIGPGKKSNHQIAFFNQDIEYLQETGDVLRTSHGLQHIGEWHSHHKLGLAEPSGHDITTVTKAIENYNLGKFFLVIANIKQESSSINGFFFKREQGRHFDYAGWVVLEGASPIRNSFDNQFDSLRYKPKTKIASIIELTTSKLGETEYVKPEYTSGYWLNDQSNHLVLKNIIDGLALFFTDVNVLQNDKNKSIYLIFKYKTIDFSLSFPADFPKSKPVVIKKDSNEKLESQIVWNPNDISKSTIEFTLKSLEENSKQLLYDATTITNGNFNFRTIFSSKI